MLRHMVASAVLAGFGAGLLAALLQFVAVQPILLTAEIYESGTLMHGGEAAADHHGSVPLSEPRFGLVGTARAHVTGTQQIVSTDGGGAVHDHPAGETTSATWTRDGLTVLFTALVYTGYALMLIAAFALAEVQGARIGARAGILWGAAGFLAVHFAPAVGLPPELPGMAAADLGARQVWWVGTAVCTALGLWSIGLGKTMRVWALGAALIALPHLVGAPRPAEMTGPVPPELAALFAGRTLGVGLAAWVTLGALAGGLWSRARA